MLGLYWHRVRENSASANTGRGHIAPEVIGSLFANTEMIGMLFASTEHGHYAPEVIGSRSSNAGHGHTAPAVSSQVKAWRLENRGLEPPKLRPGGLEIEAWSLQNRAGSPLGRNLARF